MKQLIKIKVNGNEYEVAVKPVTTLATLLREELRLTGTKVGCEMGDCGACTVLLNGKAVNSCLVLAIQAEGQSITTIEGIANGENLHPIQRAFVEKGAIQCGYCTPGMVIRTKSFLDETPHPSEEQIKEALSGNLCRCTGYTKIIEAVETAVEYLDGKEPKPIEYQPQKSAMNLSVVGKRLPKLDAPDKATGRAIYTDDIVLPNMIFGKLLLSPLPHAKIKSIDTSEALKLSGVKAILTGADVPEITYGTSPPRYDENVLAIDKVRYVGDVIAAVAAVDEETCCKALKLIKVDFDELPAVFDPIEAMKDGAPRLFDDKFENNINTSVNHHFGDVEKGFAEADYVREERFIGNRTYQNSMEPHVAIAEWDRHGRVTLYTSTQVVHYVHHQLSRILNLPLGNIRVIMTNCGGGFGAKAATNMLEVLSILLAKKTGCPVKMRFNREEMYLYGRGRHKQYIDLKIGVKKDGRITAVQQKVILEGGAYSSFGVVTTYYAGSMLPTLYKMPNYKYDGYRINTNLPPCGAFRGHGTPHPRFAFESLLSMIADDIGMDHIDIRLKNAMEPETRTCNDLDIHSCELKACLELARKKSGWDKKKGKLPKGRGIGIGCGGFVSGAGYPIYRSQFPHSNAIIRVLEDGSKAVLYIGDADIGQGSNTVLAQAAAEGMGITLDKISVVAADSDLTPIGFGAYSSRVTLMGGNASKMAGDEVRKQILPFASGLLNVCEEKIEARENKFYEKNNSENFVPWDKVAAEFFSKKGPLVGRGHYSPPEGLGGKYKGATVGTSPAFSFSASVCEVEVDMETGKVKVLNFWDAHDCGTAINPLAVEGQIEGAIVMTMSETLLEDQVFNSKGKLLNGDLHNYLIATSADIPAIDTSIVDSYEPNGPFGAKEVGEGATLPILGAIANAVADAIGVRIFELPITPEKVLNAINSKKKPD
ncbi:MAG: molybdopterin-dependent oxidoreductase [Ignavibacteriota bacterium]|nr:MAG: 4-hydroxybenzoyl-CoA reductase subunit alpha [Chlorobiota bacterium]MBL1121878.1 4-hydroxybenzoyl-CoA reductase subunit alpha [Ignavibacteriota bacterium]MCC7093663.1 molybdopterin-dependent oxidoreductase [Ignavibacteriaceae bacterium]MCE7857215.1 4-hydroxybenzoyl-CoA reductase subunit alpha [Ignavibacteria bacterium CHB3]MEB2296426.1 molybdopterin-dependent oxidoreductase [Ignavibacteria bacterium]